MAEEELPAIAAIMSKVMPALDMRTYTQLHQDRGLDWKESHMPCMSTFIVYILKPILDIEEANRL